MNSEIIEKYLEHKISAKELSGKLTIRYKDGSKYKFNDFNKGFLTYKIKLNDLKKICRDFLDGYLNSVDISSIAFELIASDYFEWDTETSDGELCAETLFNWSAPEINYDINNDYIEKCLLSLTCNDNL